MPPPPKRSPLTLFAGAVTAAFLIFSGFVVQLLWQTETSLSSMSRNEGSLGAIELRLFHAQLLRNLHDLETESHGVTAEDALLSYDIVYERLETMPARPPFPDILDQETKILLLRTFNEWAAFAPVFDKASETGTFETGASGGLIAVSEQIEKMGPALERISGRAEQLAAEARDRARAQNLDGLKLLAFALSGLMVSSLLFAGLMWRSLKVELARTRELVATRDEAVRANHAKSEFLANMSHDLRTPLNAIIGFSDIIHSQTFGPLLGKYIDYASYVKSAGEQLLILINELLDLSRVEAKRMDLAITRLHVGRLFTECADMLGIKARQKNIRIIIEDSTAGWLLEADPGRVKQMILNLLDNAIRFSHDGAQVFMTAAVQAGGVLEISVKDNGPGISKENIPKALEPFGQLKSSDPTVANEGTGLGLPIVKALAELHSGFVTVSSVVGAGTAVTVTFPPKRVIAESGPQRAASESGPQRAASESGPQHAASESGPQHAASESEPQPA